MTHYTAGQANPEIDFPSLYSVTGDVKDINTLLVPMAQAITTRNELEVFAAAGRLLAKTVEEFIELTAERDALQADAARINWLTASTESHGFCHTGFGKYRYYAHQFDGSRNVRDLIDKAMKETK